MTRLLSGLLVLLLLFAGSAWAIGSDGDIIDVTDSPEYTADSGNEHDVVIAGEGYEFDPERMGMYFGTGDEYIGGYYGDYYPYSTGAYVMQNYDSDFSYYDERVYYPEYYREGMYNYDNVYGPMWGVDPETPGLEGYDYYYYYLMSGGDPNNIPRDHRYEVSSASGEVADTEDGINISSNDSGW
ncbi:hypothetical protein JW859_05855 [bacterium]|nr:hypothetical protein [bacterium]